MRGLHPRAGTALAPPEMAAWSAHAPCYPEGKDLGGCAGEKRQLHCNPEAAARDSRVRAVQSGGDGSEREMGLTDAELVERTRAGDREAYGDLVTRYQGHVYGLAYSLAGRWEDAQDIAQETFIRAYCNLDQLREPARFPAWLRRVTVGVAVGWLRSFRPKLFARIDGQVDLETLEIPDFEPGPPEVLERKELAEAVQRAVASLPAKYRVPLTMFHLDGLSYEKVASFLDIPLGTAKSLLHRARAKLKDALGPYYAEEVFPMVAEVFNEHKLTPEFARRVLDRVPRVGKWPFQSTGAPEDHSFAGSLRGFLQFMGDDLYQWTQPYAGDWHSVHDYVMGASGIAFQLTWTPGKWEPESWDLFVMRPDPLEPIRHTFELIGYPCELLLRSEFAHILGLGPGQDDEGEYRRRITESIAAGRPVVAYGAMGIPTEWCLITGREESAAVLVGWPFYHEGQETMYAGERDPSGYFRARDWFGSTRAVIIIGPKGQRPPRAEAYRRALQWGLGILRTPQVRGRTSGLAAYGALVADLLSEEDWPKLDLAALTARYGAYAATWGHIAEARAWLMPFLAQAAGADPRWTGEVNAAAEAISGVQRAIQSWPPPPAEEKVFADDEDREARARRLAGPPVRRRLAERFREAMAKEAEAAGHLERALALVSDRGGRG
jgi:RNA polymerase sigma-70 factor (ECF subfamily)